MSPAIVPPSKFELPPATKGELTSEEIAKIVPTYKLNSGHDMPVVGYGTFRSDKGEVREAVLMAIKAGYRHFDFAHVYGNEAEIGEALAEAFSSGLVKREDLFCTGKLWNSDHDVDVVPKACDFSLKNLGIDYFDLYIIHFPVAWKHTGIATPSWGKSELGETPLIDTWRALEKLVDDGKVRSIGVSNYPLLLLHDLVTQARITPACNQIEVHPYYVRDSLVNYCLSRDICVTAHTPLGGGTLNKETWDYATPMESPIIQAIATSKGVSPAQVMIRWSLQRGCVPLPKSIRKSRLEQNIDLFSFELNDDEMAKISSLDKFQSYKTNPNPLNAFVGGPDCFTAEGTDIFD